MPGELPKQNMTKPHEQWDGKLCNLKFILKHDLLILQLKGRGDGREERAAHGRRRQGREDAQLSHRRRRELLSREAEERQDEGARVWQGR